MRSTAAPSLVRGIYRWDLLALLINGIIGAGIFGLPSTIFALSGSYSLIAVATCAVVVALIVLCFAEVSSRFDQTGGPYLYARTAFGPVVGFEIGWLTWLARITSFAALCNLFVTYLHTLWPVADSVTWRPVLIAGLTIGLTVVNLLGVRNAAVVNDGFAIGKLVPLLLLIVSGLLFISPLSLALRAAPPFGAFSKSVLLLIFAFGGFEATIIASGEMREPSRNLPWAMFTAIAAVAVIYELVQVVCIGTVPGLATSERPLADAAMRIFGATGAALISVGGLISILGTLNGIMLLAPRITFAMAEQGQLPRFLAATHPRFHTPYASILVSSAVMLVLALAGSFIGALTISTIIRVLVYGVTCAALPVLRRRADMRPAAFRVPVGSLVTAVVLVLCVWLLIHSGGHEARDVAIVAAGGAPIYFAMRLGTRRRTANGNVVPADRS